jgi:hypothetical protein
MDQKVNTEIEFLSPPVNTDMVGRREHLRKPVSDDVNGATVEFDIDNDQSDGLIDLQEVKMVLELEIRATGGNNAMLAFTEKNVTPIGNLCHSIWKNVIVHLGGKTVSDDDQMYPYRAYNEKVVSYTDAHLETVHRLSGFIKDTDMGTLRAEEDSDAGTLTIAKGSFVPERPDDTEVLVNVGTDANSCSKLREPFFHGRTHTPTSAYYEDSLYCSPFTQKCFLPKGVPIKVIFYRHNKEFYLKGTNAAGYDIHIVSFKLRIPYIELTPQAMLEVERKVETGHAKFNLKRKVYTEKSLAAGITAETFQKIFLTTNNRIPDKLYFILIPNAVHRGDFNTHPFRYRHYDLREFSVTALDKVLPLRDEADCNFSEGKYVNLYKDFLQCHHLNVDGMGSIIKFADFASGYTIFSVDLSSGMPDPDVINVPKYGNVDLSLWFRQPLPNAVTMIVTGEFSDVISFTKHKEVQTTF